MIFIGHERIHLIEKLFEMGKEMGNTQCPILFFQVDVGSKKREIRRKRKKREKNNIWDK